MNSILAFLFIGLALSIIIKNINTADYTCIMGWICAIIWAINTLRARR